jgi:ubiquinone/menaquinone biosynthesis C-methylase UbiE
MNWNAKLYDEQHSFVPEYGKELLKFVNTEKGQTILDLGCGTGVLTVQLAQNGAKVIGLDRSETMINAAKTNFSGIEFYCENATELHYENYFDCVFSNAVFHWITDQTKLLDVIYKVLKTPGQLVCEFGAKNCLRQIWASFAKNSAKQGYQYQSHYFYPTAAEYTKLLHNAGFLIEYIREYERPTPLNGGANGLRNFVCQFLADDLAKISSKAQDAIFAEMEADLKPTLWNGARWIADYTRLQVIAHKK